MNTYSSIDNIVGLIGLLVLLGFLVPQILYFFEHVMSASARSTIEERKASLMPVIFNAFSSRKNEVLALYREYKALFLTVHGVALLSSLFAFQWETWTQRMISGGIILLFSVLVTYLAAMHLRNLNDRAIAAQDKTNSWRVSVNSVDVGEISDARLVDILKFHRFSVMNWIYYGSDCVGIFVRGTVRTITAIPTIVFIIVALAYLLAPVELTEYVIDLHQYHVTGSGDSPGASLPLFIGALLVTHWVVDVYISLSKNRNTVDEKIADRILMAVGSASRGSVYVYREHDIWKTGFIGRTSA